jgi:hypothetical protein
MFTFEAQRNKKNITPACRQAGICNRLFMSLNSIKFDPADIASLYKNSLVEINTAQQVLIPSETNGEPVAKRWKYLGENKKKTLIIVRNDDAVHIPDRQLSFLTKLLAACNLNLEDVAVLNFQNHDSTEFNEILNYFKPKAILLFAVEPGEFGLPMIFPQFQVQGYKNAMFVSAPSLDLIEPDKSLKGKLWVCLKKIFNL